MESGTFCYYGIARALTGLFEIIEANNGVIPETIFIDVNADGLPLAKSSRSHVPILGRVTNIKNFRDIFVIGCYHGYEKLEDPHIYLEQFCLE